MKKNYFLKSTLLLFGFILLTLVSFSSVYSQNFAPLGSGANGSTVRAVIVYDGELVIAGDFTSVGGVSCNGIAKWNGSVWAPLGFGVTGGSANALAVFGNDLYVTGSFTNAGGGSANRIAKWNGSTWTSLGLGLNGTGEALTVHNNTLYVGGSFTTAGGVTVNRVASWSGTAWSSLGAGTNGTVNALISFSNELYVGGSFTTVGGVPVGRIARWNGSNWNTVGSGVEVGSNVYAFQQLGNNLIVGGFYTNIGGVSTDNIASWNGASFSALAGGLTGGSVRAMTTYLGELYVGGLFTSAGGGPTVNRIARWNGSNFNALSTGCNGDVRSLGVFDATLILGGGFTGAGPIVASHIAKWGSIPVAPVLSSPSNAATNVNLTPLLEWGAVNNAFDYSVQLTNDPNFNSTLIDQSGITDPEYQVPGGTLMINNVYFWRANARNGMGTGPFSSIFFFSTGATGIVNVSGEVPERYGLYNNYPNPFNPTTKIKFDIPSNGANSNVNLVIFDASGRLVSTLVNSQLNPGTYEFEFTATDLTSGVYFYRLTTDNFVDTKKMILVK